MVSAAAAKRLVDDQLPPDAHLTEDHQKSACELLLYQSATLADVLGSPKIGDTSGSVGVAFSSSDFNHYSPEQVVTIIYSIGWPGYSDGSC